MPTKGTIKETSALRQIAAMGSEGHGRPGVGGSNGEDKINLSGKLFLRSIRDQEDKLARYANNPRLAGWRSKEEKARDKKKQTKLPSTAADLILDIARGDPGLPPRDKVSQVYRILAQIRGRMDVRYRKLKVLEDQAFSIRRRLMYMEKSLQDRIDQLYLYLIVAIVKSTKRGIDKVG
ncbi:hypothetical protein I203_107615 [Kwoniella mangroviensis CBS 8507]|uniref:hypothetical protein n=1 Tax=Kwoniella mangroviensis CBS 8507 TaxID=1296122 RepID=UPI00080D4902|nr:uncharacterized protein I203_02363 [Kwoniella mangroviensis CBS 8507]OCF68969.1 hypothetical protein I203_02363 [Kwoniella mangroviensis CBS 8507]